MAERRVGGFQTWKCIVCGEPVIEGQRFLWVPNKGYAHLECVKGLIAEKSVSLDPDTVALLDASEAVSYAIVRVKAAARLASGNVAEELVSSRKKLEGIAARLEMMLYEKLKEKGVEI